MSVSTSKSRAERLREAIRLKQESRRPRRDVLPARPTGEPALLDEQQRGIWLAHSLDPGSPAYNLVSACRVHGPLDTEALNAAFCRLVARHRLLRSTFTPRDGEVLQVINEQVPTALERIEAAPGRAIETAVSTARRPFDLTSGPLVRLQLVEETNPREGESDSPILLLVLHHILSDERSLARLWLELADGCVGKDPGADGEPEEYFPQYDDWAWWRRSTRQERTGAETPDRDADLDLDFWRRQLSPLPTDLDLPLAAPAMDRPEATTPNANFIATPDAVTGGKEAQPGRLLVRSLGAPAAARLRRLAVSAGSTPFLIGAFAWRLLLQRLARDPSFAFATPVSTRSHPELVRMLGAFINPVVITASVDESQPVAEALRHFDGQVREVLGHASTPFHTIAGSLAPPRQDAGHPLFQTLYVHQERVPLPALGGARLEELQLDLGASKFDLTLFLTEDGESLELAAEYRTDRFEQAAIELLLRSYGYLLDGLATDPRRRVGALSLLAPSEEKRLERWASGPPLDLSATEWLPVQIHRRALEHPDAPALLHGGQALGYGDLLRRAAMLEGQLRAVGVERGDRVGLFLSRGADLIAGLLGIQRIGAAYVPLDPAYPAARNRRVLADADVRAVLTSEALTNDLVADRADHSWSLVAIDAPATAAAGHPGSRDLEALEEPRIQAEDAAYVLYTSGSTGQPKGVVVTHGNLRASTAARLQFYREPDADGPPRFLLLPSVAFDSSVAGIFGTLAAGGALVLPADEQVLDPRRLGRLIRDASVTHLLCVPSLYSKLLEADADAVATLRMALVAGEACPQTLPGRHFRAAPKVRLFNEYGPTEGTVWATVQELTATDGSGPVPIGHPIPGVRVEVLDSGGRPLPVGLPGRAWLAGPTVAAGYWRQPELTAERFRNDPGGKPPGRRYDTGDLASWTGDGRLLFHGRLDQQLKLRGLRIEPGEVEAALTGLDGVREAAVVIRRPAAGAAEQLVAFVATASESTQGWRDALTDQLPAYMIPGRFVALEQLPRLPNGKVDRGRLATRELAPEATSGSLSEAPGSGSPGNSNLASSNLASSSEEFLTVLWEGLLGRSAIGPDENFFTLGGHSLLAVELALAVERDLAVDLAPADLFAYPTVRQLAARIDELARAGRAGGQAGEPAPRYEHLFPIHPGGAGDPVVVAIPHFFADVFADRYRGERPVYGLRGVGMRPEGNLGRWRTMTELGTDLLDEIQRRFPERPVTLAGYSFGASMALETARLMERRGLPVRALLLIAPMPFDRVRLGPMRLQIEDLRQPAEELTASQALRRWLGANRPWASAPYRRLWRRTAVEGWRRTLCQVGRLRQKLGLPLTESILWADVRVDRFRLHSTYRPDAVHVPTVIFNPIEPGTDAAATWSRVFRGPLQVVPTPDPHLDKEAVAAARRVVLEHLAELDDA